MLLFFLFGLLTAVVLMTVVFMTIVLFTVVIDELDSVLALKLDRLERDLLDSHALLALLVEVLSAAETATERERALLGVSVGGRVGHSKWAVDAAAVANLDLVVWLFAVLIVAPLTEEVSAKAVPHCHGAAEHALPVDVLIAVLVTSLLASAVSVHGAVPAAQVLLAGPLLDSKLGLAVDHSSEVGLLAVIALVERAAVEGELEELALIMVTWGGEALILVKALVLSDLKSHLLDRVAELVEGLELSIDQLAARLFDLLLAAGARHEGEGDLEGAPLVLEELVDAVGMEDMPAAELHTGLLAKLARVADRAELACILKGVLVAALLQAGEAVGLTSGAVALMTALVNFVALLDQGLAFLVFGVELFLLDLDAKNLEFREGSLDRGSGSVDCDLDIILHLFVDS